MKENKVTWIKIYDENLERESRAFVNGLSKKEMRSFVKKPF